MSATRALCLLLLPATAAGREFFNPPMRVVQTQAVYAAYPPSAAQPVYVAYSPAAAVPSRSSAPTALLAAAFLGTAAATFALGGRAARMVSQRMEQSRLRMQSAGDVKLKKIFVLGGDGFCGWPTALHLADAGHQVVILDNLSRRKIDVETGCSSLTPIRSIEERVDVWNGLEKRAHPLRFQYMDIAKEYDRFTELLVREQPDTIIHFAEQRSAPYSMKDPDTSRYTVDNNTSATHNVLVAIKDVNPDIHLVHLGTMGVYGYGNSGGEIPEGYIDVVLPGDREQTILHPAYPGSVYHATKCLDQTLFQFYQKNDKLRITDLHQGIVWGTNTPQTCQDDRLCNRFDYDGDYGTVLNRFLMQAQCGIPLTVYGTGGQTRAFIHITDTCRCIEAAVNNPPKSGDRVDILNQVAQTYRVRDVAELVSKLTGAKVQYITNPRQEAAENELDVRNEKFKLLGLNPLQLQENDGLLQEVTQIVGRFSDRVDKNKVISKSYWNKARREEHSVAPLDALGSLDANAEETHSAASGSTVGSPREAVVA
jgi:UDP-sulfoquinovose synthase